MENRAHFAGFQRFARAVTLLDVAILGGLAVIAWLAGWTLYQLGEGLVLVGAAALVIGISSVLGNWGATRTFEYKYSQSVSDQSMSDRTRQEAKDNTRSYSFVILMAAVGLIAIVIGTFIQFAARS